MSNRGGKMAGNEGTTQTELWSSVVHQPSEDPEESELPSTVDMAAFSSGLNGELSAASQNSPNSDSDTDSEVDSSNSGSEASQSCSQSDSSDSDSSTSSIESSSRSPSPEFSVTSSQTNGLRLTIATVKKPSVSPTNEKMAKPVDDSCKPAKPGNCSSSSGSPCSTDSESDSDNSASGKVASKAGVVKSAKTHAKKSASSKLRTRTVEKKEERKSTKKEATTSSSTKSSSTKVRTKQKKSKKMASLPLARGTTYSSSDSEDSDADRAILASCSLQEIRQEDLAAILPDQQECDAFGDFECNRVDKNSPQTGDVSGSDMELPQQAVNALIQRTTESSSESESHAPLNPSALHANSLLQQFAAQTQMLNAPCPVIPQNSGEASKAMALVNCEKQNNNNNNTSIKESDVVKRKRGRPKKGGDGSHKSSSQQQTEEKAQNKSNSSAEYCADPNVSPDSGIQNSPDHVSSPEPSPSPNSKTKHAKEDTKKSAANNNSKAVTKSPDSGVDKATAKSDNTVTVIKTKELAKLSVTSNRFDRLLYGNADKVLYPPRRKVGRPPLTKKGPGRPPKPKPLPAAPPEAKPPEKPAAPTTVTTQPIPKLIKAKADSRPVLATRNKFDNSKVKFATLKSLKVMHSKHKHKKHRKYKFRILKPLGASVSPAITDPKITMEIDKLIADFDKQCVIGSSAKPPKENVPEVPKATVKKISKKRKTTEHSERKKKKVNVSATVNKVASNLNEQRLPLKKRHYLFSDNKSNVKSSQVKTEETSPKEEKVSESSSSSAITATTPKKRHRLEATITTKEKEVPAVKEVRSNAPVPVVAESVPKTKAKLSLEHLITELKMKRTLSTRNTTIPEKSVTPELKKSEPKKSAPEVKKAAPEVKKTAPEVKKTAPEVKKAAPEVKKAALEVKKAPPEVKKAAPEVKKAALEVKKTAPEVKKAAIDVKKAAIEVKKAAPELKKVELRKVELKKDVVLPSPPPPEPEPVVVIIKTETVVAPQDTPVVKKVLKVMVDTSKKKMRKRRAINRTGFPTVKKKKKKLLVPVEETFLTAESTEADEGKPVIDCDRVPKEGEEYNKFIQRTEKPEPVTVSPVVHDQSSLRMDDPSKWEMMSECDSLPQDERIEMEQNENGDLEEISLDASIERLKSRLDKRKRKRGNDKSVDNGYGYPKRRLRDISPASSIEPYMERRLRDERASASGDEKKGRRAPRWRKRYLVAGLFSDYFKEDEETAMKRTETAAKSSRLTYIPSEHPYGLLPPPHHCGRYLRCRKLPFRLPFDLWWQHTHSQLPGRDVVPSWNYRKIRTNVYNVKTTTGACEPQACNCTSAANCGDDCINRLVLAECPASHRCQNQKIQRHEWAPGIEKFMTDLKGWGVRTKLPIKSGEFILEYVGEVVADQEFKERMASIYVHDTHHYCLHLDGGLVIDGHRMGGDGRFVNHSCEPNCEMQKWSVNGQFRMALFALRDIESSEELTYDYNFSLFNPAEGQECKCGSDMCRGVIGGKTQRVRQLPVEVTNNKANPGRVGRPRKNQAAKKTNNTGPTEKKELPPPPPPIPILPMPQVKPMSHQQKCFILEHHCFLLRNLTKVRKGRDKTNTPITVTPRPAPMVVQNQATFINQLNALQKPRNIRTRRVAQAEGDPELKKTLKIASVLKEIWNAVTKAKNEKNEPIGTLFMNMPSKRKVPEFYQRITNPIDLSTIEHNIATGVYLTPESFNSDMNRLFLNYIRFYGRTNELGVAAIKLKKIYAEAKQQSLAKFENVLGTKPPANFVSNRKKSEEEDIIRCICGMPRDEGLMIQCERCMVWQHSECVKADVSADSFYCEQCVPRKVDYEIPLDEFTEHGHRYYLTLLRDDLQLRQGDTVYVLRDIPIPGTNRKHNYRTIGKIEYSELDIFRIERLWKDSKTGQRFAYGHHYLRPHETYHEPTRKFFPNEVMRVPLYEAVPVDLVISHCWVMDLNTFCKGRPINAPEDHIYICEYRVDKSARLFSKVSKSKFPICTKSFAFERFENRLKVSRTYTPHDLDPSLVKPRGRKTQDIEEPKDIISAMPIVHVPIIVRTPAEQKARLNKILLNLLSKMSTKQVLDVSYLLEGGRRRKKVLENSKS